MDRFFLNASRKDYNWVHALSMPDESFILTLTNEVTQIVFDLDLNGIGDYSD
jgi:hypothetical protein